MAVLSELVQIPGGDGRYGDAGRIENGGRTPGVKILRVESGLFFANSDWVRDRVCAAAANTEAVILDASDIPFIDVTAGQMLDELSDTLDSEGVTLGVAVTPTSSVTWCDSPTPSTSWTASIRASRRPSKPWPATPDQQARRLCLLGLDTNARARAPSDPASRWPWRRPSGWHG